MTLLSYEEWDYSQPVPQAPAFKKWLKSHLAAGHAIAWFPMCKGDGSHVAYPGSCPGGGPSGDASRSRGGSAADGSPEASGGVINLINQTLGENLCC